MKDSLPWLLVVALVVVLFGMRSCDGSAVADALSRAEAAEDSLAVLAPLAASLMASAVRSDTVLVQVTDTLTRTIERLRIEREVVVDSILDLAAPEVVALVAELQASHAAELEAVEAIAAENLLWGEGWRETALALEAENMQLRLRGDAWSDAFDAQRRQTRWTRVGGVGLAALAVFAFVR